MVLDEFLLVDNIDREDKNIPGRLTVKQLGVGW